MRCYSVQLVRVGSVAIRFGLTWFFCTPLKTLAGGSVANIIRGLSNGFGISSGIIGGVWGMMSKCVCLVDDFGNHTMRPCLSNGVKVQEEELTKEDFKGSKWLVLRYAILNLEVIQAAILLAKQEGLLVSLDLASFEMVRNFK
ncbi:hypothetical protein GYH30_000621 [Glycine max]|uniref:Carbohydrate kinase PfkB domain-containing protein n=2 Tax=Glycine subgen. Soja TaxID=1462606 RepID=A0A0R0LFU8_SOYBN|nr:hypothetical protein GYH30_000621 [Glycine max]RZC28698.1 hypothetical protein D0Y65_000599 [Glycine soja]